MEELEHRTQASADPLTVCMVDLDGFKAVNDTHGHLAGDEVLKHVAQTLSRAGATVGRFGGDEFLVLITGRLGQAHLFVRNIEEEFAAFRLADRSLPIRASFGFACHPADATKATELIRLADDVMYRERRARLLVRGAGAVSQ